MTTKNDALDLMVVSDYDSSITRDTTWVLNQMDTIIQESVDKKDVDIALDAFQKIRAMAQLSGLALARGIYKLFKSWKKFGIQDDFIDYIYARISLNRFTVERYIKVAAMWDKDIVPEEFILAIQSRNIADQVPLAMAVSQGYVFDDDEWKALAHAPDRASFVDLIRKFKKEEGRSSRLVIMMDRDGRIYVQQKNYSKQFVGTLEIDSSESAVRQAVERIIRGGGILRR